MLGCGWGGGAEEGEGACAPVYVCVCVLRVVSFFFVCICDLLSINQIFLQNAISLDASPSRLSSATRGPGLYLSQTAWLLTSVPPILSLLLFHLHPWVQVSTLSQTAWLLTSVPPILSLLLFHLHPSVQVSTLSQTAWLLISFLSIPDSLSPPVPPTPLGPSVHPFSDSMAALLPFPLSSCSTYTRRSKCPPFLRQHGCSPPILSLSPPVPATPVRHSVHLLCRLSDPDQSRCLRHSLAL